MYLIIGLAVAAVAAVLLYNRSRDTGGETADGWVGRAQQLAAVVLVLARAVESLIQALDRSAGSTYSPRPATGWGGSHLAEIYDDREDWR